jgi:hypothetical protein
MNDTRAIEDILSARFSPPVGPELPRQLVFDDDALDAVLYSTGEGDPTVANRFSDEQEPITLSDEDCRALVTLLLRSPSDCLDRVEHMLWPSDFLVVLETIWRLPGDSARTMLRVHIGVALAFRYASTHRFEDGLRVWKNLSRLDQLDDCPPEQVHALLETLQREVYDACANRAVSYYAGGCWKPSATDSDELVALLGACRSSDESSARTEAQPEPQTSAEADAPGYPICSHSVLLLVSKPLAVLLGQTAEDTYDAGKELRRAILTIPVMEAVAGPEHPYTQMCVNHLLRTIEDLGCSEEAARLGSHICQAHSRTLGPDHPILGIAYNNHAAQLVRLRRFGEAEHLLRRGREILPTMPNLLYWLGRLYRLRRRKGDRELERQAWAEFLSIGGEPSRPERKREAEDRLSRLTSAGPKASDADIPQAHPDSPPPEPTGR